MDPIFLITALGSVAITVAGLVFACYLERRSLGAPKARKTPEEGDATDPS